MYLPPEVMQQADLKVCGSVPVYVQRAVDYSVSRGHQVRARSVLQGPGQVMPRRQTGSTREVGPHVQTCTGVLAIGNPQNSQGSGGHRVRRLP